MPEPIRMSRRTCAIAWAVLCVAGFAATAGLKAASESGPRPEKPVSAECGEYIAYIEMQLGKAKLEGEGDQILAFSRGRFVGTADDCGDDLRDHFRGDR
ncbi:hypothetical protein [Streptomyces sp. rh34]|uniref:hypothetical protein n=1 Tax=Streptomyces sp. rh34 TaxID=2034272 RepID=UPI000BEF6E58|nr:hypothetical protein [Streptomyces sp. rh34]